MYFFIPVLSQRVKKANMYVVWVGKVSSAIVPFEPPIFIDPIYLYSSAFLKRETKEQIE